MLLLFLSWIVIFLVSYGTGIIGISLFCRFFDDKGEANYSIFETLLIGLSCLLIPLQLWSLFLPSNQYFLGLALLGSLFTFVYKREFILRKFKSAWLYVKSFSYFQLFLMFLFVFITFGASLWERINFDAEFYHFQAILWNEKYPVIPGLGNIEDRLGFNSNYFLLSAIFSLRFIVGEPVYGLQSLIFVAFILWGFSKLVKSKNEIKYIALFGGLVLFSILNLLYLFSTSTDILPNILFLYLVLLIMVDVSNINKKMLLYLLVPLMIVTLKISLAPIVFLTILVLYNLLRRRISLMKIVSLIIVVSPVLVFWLVRNVILSGYLIYPIFEVDLFSVDWKIPKEIAMLQKQYIYDFPISGWRERILDTFVRGFTPVWYNVLTLGVVGIFVLLLPCIIYFAYRKLHHNFDLTLFTVLFLSLCTVFIGFINGFDIRFISGALIFLISFGNVSLLESAKMQSGAIYANVIIVIFFLSYGLWSTTHLYSMTNEIMKVSSSKKDSRHWSYVLLTQYPYHEVDYALEYTPSEKRKVSETVKIGGKFEFYIPKTELARGKFPYIYKVADFHHAKLTDYNCLEARGENIEDGFRMNIDCVRENLYKVKNAMREEGY